MAAMAAAAQLKAYDQPLVQSFCCISPYRCRLTGGARFSQTLGAPAERSLAVSADGKPRMELAVFAIG